MKSITAESAGKMAGSAVVIFLFSHTFQATVNELLSRGFSQETQKIRQKNMEAILYKDS